MPLRADLLEQIKAISSAAGEVDGEAKRRLDEIEALFEIGAARASHGTQNREAGCSQERLTICAGTSCGDVDMACGTIAIEPRCMVRVCAGVRPAGFSPWTSSARSCLAARNPNLGTARLAKPAHPRNDNRSSRENDGAYPAATIRRAVDCPTTKPPRQPIRHARRCQHSIPRGRESNSRVTVVKIRNIGGPRGVAGFQANASGFPCAQGWSQPASDLAPLRQPASPPVQTVPSEPTRFSARSAPSHQPRGLTASGRNGSSRFEQLLQSASVSPLVPFKQ